MRHNESRIGRFTSSQVYRLMGSDAVRNTYIEEKIYERRLQKCLDGDSYSQAMAWGQFMEIVLFNLLGLEWKIESKLTMEHPDVPELLAGSRDLFVPDVKIGEIKAFQFKAFCQLADVIRLNDVQALKKKFPAIYWQCVSNASISGVKKAEIILYMPYESELEGIRQMANDYDGENLWHYKFIAEKDIKDLPSLKDGGYYQNVNSFEFDIIPEDEALLLTTVKKYGEQLINSTK